MVSASIWSGSRTSSPSLSRMMLSKSTRAVLLPGGRVERVEVQGGHLYAARRPVMAPTSLPLMV